MARLMLRTPVLVHEAFQADDDREHAGMLDELAHLGDAARKSEEIILGKRGRVEEDNTSLMVSGGVL